MEGKKEQPRLEPIQLDPKREAQITSQPVSEEIVTNTLATQFNQELLKADPALSEEADALEVVQDEELGQAA